MKLGLTRLLIALVLGGAVYWLTQISLAHVPTVDIIVHFSKLSFVLAAFIAVAFYLRGKLAELLNGKDLSTNEFRRLSAIIRNRKRRLTLFMVGAILVAILLGILPILSNNGFGGAAKIAIYIGVIGFCEILYFLILIILSFSEAENFRHKLMERARNVEKKKNLLKKLN